MKAINRPTYAENALSDGDKLEQWERYQFKLRLKKFWNKYDIAIKRLITIFVILIVMIALLILAGITETI